MYFVEYPDVYCTIYPPEFIYKPAYATQSDEVYGKFEEFKSLYNALSVHEIIQCIIRVE